MATRIGDERRAAVFHVVTVVWGHPYVSLFLDVVLPNRATPGNLGALPAGSRYRILTTPVDADILAASESVRRARQMLPVDVVAVPELADESVDSFRRLTDVQRLALAGAWELPAALMFLNADHFMSEGSIAAVVRRHAEGARAVVSTGVRLDKSTFVPALKARGNGFALSSRELVALGLDHFHPFTRLHMVDAPRTARRPISLYWNLPGEGLLARAFFLQPIMVDPMCPDVVFRGTIDADYLVGACPVREDVHVVTDSDEVLLFELSDPAAARVPTVASSVSPWRAAELLSPRDTHQRWYFKQPVVLHAHDLDGRWTAVQQRSRRFARQTAWIAPVARLWLRVAPRRFSAGLRRGRPDPRKWMRRRLKPFSSKRIRRQTRLAAAFVVEPLRTMRKRTARLWGRAWTRLVRP